MSGFINASARFCNIASGRTATGIMQSQKPLREEAAITRHLQAFEQLCELSVALIKPLEGHAFGISGRQGSATFTSLAPRLFSSGGGTMHFDAGEVMINNAVSEDALEFWSSLALKDQVVPPEAPTWEFEEKCRPRAQCPLRKLPDVRPLWDVDRRSELSKTGGK